ncbi:MAG: hypothetical protein KF802_04080 [Bdellovibrionaceae bacterium]|nr:hypothetical protein [Pseudobdellovibrionaceae bacterium]
MKNRMNLNPTQKKLSMVVLMLAALVLSGCGAAKSTDSADLSSRVTDTSNTARAWSYCNEGLSQGQSFKLSLYSYTENSQVRNDLMYAMPSALPSDFTTSNDYFQFYRWQASAGSATYLDTSPLSFSILNPSTGATILSTRTALRWSDVSGLAAQMGVSTPKDFFRRVWIIIDLKDPSAQFDALMTVLYRNDNSQRDHSNMLLPIFDANPAGYATEPGGGARPKVLRDIHPFNGTSWTTEAYKSGATSLCAAFSS